MQYHSALWAGSSATQSRSSKFLFSLACTSVLTVGVGLVDSQPSLAQMVSESAATPMTVSPTGRSRQLPPEVARQVLQNAAQRSRLPQSQLQITRVTEQTFRNACVFEFGRICNYLNEPIAGWEATVSVNGKPWRYHISQADARIALDPGAATEMPVSVTPSAHMNAVMQDAARRAKVAPTDVRILDSKAVTFANPCMLHFGEFCNRAYQPIEGFEVLAQVNGQTWKYNVDRPAARVILDPRTTITPVSTPAVMPVSFQTRILTDAATRSGLPVASLQMTQATAKTFSNACVFGFGEMCPTIYQPVEGWETVVRVRDQAWTYRIDRTGVQMALDPRITNTGRLPASVETAILQDAKTWTGSPTVKIVSAKAQTWGNDCAFNFGKICPANFQPVEGWVVQVNSGSVEWTYHATKTGNRVVMDRQGVLPTPVATAITRDIVKRSGPSVQPNTLRFLDVKAQSKRVCFLFGGCREEPIYLTIVSNGRQQWGYQSDDKGRQVLPIAIAQVQQAKDSTISQR